VIIESRPVKLTTRTGVSVNRTIPHAKLRKIGAWCFVDHFGPAEQTDGMVVAAHPHTGLQTVTWLFEGQIEHRDSIGSMQLIEPGQLNLMTAGHGISHSELSLATTARLHAVQLWVALPKAVIEIEPAFEHQSELPAVKAAGLEARVLVGDFMGASSPTTSYSPLVGAELRVQPGRHSIALNPNFEHGFLLIEGDATFGGEGLALSALKFVPLGEESVSLETEGGATLMLLGGEPLGEKILMWWNFIGRTHEDITAARHEWNARGARFGAFEDKIGGWIPAPDLPNVTLQPR
jgi:quercetin 2,3-dioxygenase